MRDNERLLLAMGEIDDTMIADAALPYNPFAKAIRRIGVIAASLVFCVTLALILANNLPFFDLGGNMSGGDGSMNGSAGDGMNGGSSSDGSNDEGYGGTENDGDPYKRYCYAGSLELINISGGEYTFILNLNGESIHLEAAVALTDRYGASKSASTLSGSVLSPRIKVDGAEAYEFPTEAGEYTVTLDIIELIDAGYSFGGKIRFDGFGEFDLTK